jgi:hypothetical protein
MLANPSIIKVNQDHLDNNILDPPPIPKHFLSLYCGFLSFLRDSFRFHKFLFYIIFCWKNSLEI